LIRPYWTYENGKQQYRPVQWAFKKKYLLLERAISFSRTRLTRTPKVADKQQPNVVYYRKFDNDLWLENIFNFIVGILANKPRYPSCVFNPQKSVLPTAKI